MPNWEHIYIKVSKKYWKLANSLLLLVLLNFHCWRANSYGGVHEIFFRKKIFSWFYSRYQNVPISHKKICLQIFPNTKGLATIRLQNRALSPSKSALFCSFIMDLPLVLGNFWGVIFFCLSGTFWYLDQFLKSKMMKFPCL